VPSIASEVKAAMKPMSQPQSSAADRAPPAPFESLLDDSQAAAQPEPQPKTANAQRSARSDASKHAATSKDPKSTKADSSAKADKAGKTAKSDKADTADKTDATADDAQAADSKTDGDAKADAKTAAKTDAQAVAADMLTAAVSGTPAAVTPVATALPAATAVTPPAAASLDPAQAQAIADDAAAIPVAAVAATLAPAITATLAAGTKAAPAAEAGKADAKANSDLPGLLADQGDDETTSTDATVATKAAGPAHAEGKPVNPDDKQAAEPAHPDRALADAQPAAGGSQAAAAKAGTDAVQPLAITASAQHAAAPAAPAAAPAAQIAQQFGQAVPLAGVAIEIASKAVAGKNHFDIRLDPPELGRIEVRLDVGRDGSISSHVIADRKDTLDLLQRDASGLQRAFEDAGLKTSDQGMQFSLRDHSTGQQQPTPNTINAQLVVEDETPIETLPVTYSRLAGSGGGLDIRV
jgi:flagellar hook-length control protein FliK